MIALLLIMGFASTGITEAFSKFGCKFEDSNYKFELTPNSMAEFGDEISTPLELSEDEYSTFYTEVDKINQDVFDNVIFNSLESYIEFFKSYKIARGKGRNTHPPVKTNSSEVEDQTDVHAATGGFCFAKFFKDYRAKYEPNSETSSRVISVLDRIVKANSQAAKSIYLVPVSLTHIKNRYMMKSFFDHVAGVIFISIKQKDGQERLGYIVINQSLTIPTVTLMLDGLAPPEVKQNDEVDSNDDDDDEPIDELEVDLSDNSSKETVEPDYFQWSGEYRLKAVALNDTKFIMANKRTDLMDVTAIYNLNYPICSFLESIVKPQLLKRNHAVMKRNLQDAWDAYIWVDTGFQKYPHFTVAKNDDDKEDTTKLYFDEVPEKSDPFNPALYEEVLKTLGLSTDKINDYKAVLAEIYHDVFFITESGKAYSSRVKYSVAVPVDKSKDDKEALSTKNEEKNNNEDAAVEDNGTTKTVDHGIH